MKTLKKKKQHLPDAVKNAIFNGLAEFFPDFSTPEFQEVASKKSIEKKTEIVVWKIGDVFYIKKKSEIK